MINLLINSFAPVAILILIGYISAKKSIFSKENSIAIIKYVGVVAVPALTLKIILIINPCGSYVIQLFFDTLLTTKKLAIS